MLPLRLVVDTMNLRLCRLDEQRSFVETEEDGALALSYGFQKRAITMLKRLTLVTLFLHVRRAVHLKKERSRLAILRRSCQHRGPACDERPRPKVMKVGGNYVCP